MSLELISSIVNGSGYCLPLTEHETRTCPACGMQHGRTFWDSPRLSSALLARVPTQREASRAHCVTHSLTTQPDLNMFDTSFAFDNPEFQVHMRRVAVIKNRVRLVCSLLAQSAQRTVFCFCDKTDMIPKARNRVPLQHAR